MKMLKLALVWAGTLGQLLPGRLAAQDGSPAAAVPVERLRARREALLKKMRIGVAVLRSASERSGDPPDPDYPQDSDFRQDNDFFYLTGLETPDSWLVLVAKESGPGQVILYLPPRDPVQERWTGAQLGPGVLAAQETGIPEADIRSTEKAEAEIRDRVTGQQSLAAVPGGAFYFKHSKKNSESEFIRSIILAPFVQAADLQVILWSLRQVKDENEIWRLRRAAEISAQGHLAAMRATKPGVWEYEVEAAAEGTFRRLGAERVAYPSIVGTGGNGTVLHYDKNRAKAESGELMVMDMAAEFGYYAADVTRTIPVSGHFTPHQRALYDLVLGAQQVAIDSTRPGVRMRDLDGIARRYLHDHSGDLCGKQTCDTFFIHGLSHHIGMDVHDPAVSDLLEPGMVFTIEPGVYLPDEKTGIRIEDDILVTPEGHEVLSAGAPRRAEDVEKAVGKP